MGRIVSIGGGEIKLNETLHIDKEIIRLTGKKKPKALFIPTASGDPSGYYELFKKAYSKLGCTCDVLYLLKEKLSAAQIKKKILSADLIYVGGGNTLRMLKLWRKKGVDKLLIKAHKKGIVLSGLSAGAICWARFGSSDSRKFSNPKNWKLIKIKGLHLLPLTLSPHHLREPIRTPKLKEIMKTTPGIALGLDDNCALIVEDDSYRLLASKKGARAHKMYRTGNKVVHEVLKADNKKRKMEELLKR